MITFKQFLAEASPKETASQAFARLEKFKKLWANPSPEQQRTLDGIEKIANSLMDTEMDSKLKSFETKHAGADWWQLGKKLYPVSQDDNEWVVKSEAKDWTVGKEWRYDYKVQALEQVQKLMQYKSRDRKAGYGDKEEDLEKWSKKYGS